MPIRIGPAVNLGENIGGKNRNYGITYTKAVRYQDEAAGKDILLELEALQKAIAPATAAVDGLMSAADKKTLDAVAVHAFVTPSLSLVISTAGSDATGDGSSAKPFATFAGAWNYVLANSKGYIGKLTFTYRAGTYNHDIVLPDTGAAISVRELIISGPALVNNEPQVTINLTTSFRISGIATSIDVNYLKLNLADGTTAPVVEVGVVSELMYVRFASVWFKRGSTAGRGVRVPINGFVYFIGYFEFEGNFTEAMLFGGGTLVNTNLSSLTFRNGSAAYVISIANRVYANLTGTGPVYDSFATTRFASATVGSQIYLTKGTTTAQWSNGASSIIDGTSIMTPIT